MTHAHYRTSFCRTLIHILCILSLLTSSACGKKGPPRPPETLAPSSVKQLTAKSEADSITLSWDTPTTRADGKTLSDLSGFVVKRSIYIRGEKHDFQALGEVIATHDEKTEALTTNSFHFTDRSVQPGKIYDYLVIPFNTGHVEGQHDQILRVTFRGLTSVVEHIP